MSVIDRFLETERRHRESADAQVSPEQLLYPGDYCTFPTRYGFVVYCEILDAAASLLGGRLPDDLDAEEREEYEATRNSYVHPDMRYYRFARSYSVQVPRGELGDVHLSRIARKLSREEFEAARANGWK